MRNATMTTDTDAFTGLEAAIVLIAFITVASVFSYVILGAGFQTTQKSQEVIHSGLEQTSTSMMITGSVYGISLTGSTIDMINMTTVLSAGGGAIDFEKVTITYSTASRLESLTPVPGWSAPSTTPGSWAIISKQNDAGSSNNLLEKGEQFTISVHPSIGVDPDERFNIDIKPSVGASIQIIRDAPPGIKTVNVLY